MAFKNEQRCKICVSLLRPEIDNLLSNNTPYKKIVDFAKKKGLEIGGHNITRHKQRHMKINDVEIETSVEEHHKKEQSVKDSEKKAISKIVNANLVLEEIISRAYEGIITNKLSPSISDALKAVELKTKLKEQHAVESTLLEFMLQFTKESDKVVKETSLKIVTSADRPANILTSLEDFSGARIRTGIEAENIARSSEIETKNVNLLDKKYKGAFEKTVDDDIDDSKQTVIQTSFLNIVPETKNIEESI